MIDSPIELTKEEEDLYDMSDEELEAAFKAAKSSLSVDTDEDIIEIDEIVGTDLSTEEDKEGEDINVDDITLEQPADALDSNDVIKVEDDVVEVDSDPVVDPVTLDEDVSDKAIKDEDNLEIEPEIQKYKVKADGIDLEFTNDELLKLAPKALNYTRKMQEIAKWKKSISALEENKISHEQMNLMIDAYKGDKQAIAELIKINNIDTMELDTDADTPAYIPKEYGKSDLQITIKEIEDRIKGDPEFTQTSYVINKSWDQSSVDTLRNRPSLIEDLHYDVKNGIFDKVNPIAFKLKALDGGIKSDIEYYIAAGRQYTADLENSRAKEALTKKMAIEKEKLIAKQAVEAERLKAVEVVKAREAQQKEVQKASEARKAAAPTKKVAGTVIVDYLDEISESDYDKWRKALEDRR